MPTALPPEKKSETEFDVELVPITMPPQGDSNGDGFHLSRRDFVMLGTGAGGVLFAVVIGWLQRRREARRIVFVE